MGDTLNYKLWAIKVEISKLKRLIKLLPDSSRVEERRQRLANLQKDLAEIES
jgi:hypothetical protein